MKFVNSIFVVFFFFNDTATTEIYTLSLHDALPICRIQRNARGQGQETDRRVGRVGKQRQGQQRMGGADRKSTRLNSSHGYISYAVFCLKKKKQFNEFPCLLPHSFVLIHCTCPLTSH